MDAHYLKTQKNRINRYAIESRIETQTFTNIGRIQLIAFCRAQKCRLSDWLAILANQSESLHFFVLYEHA